jgi:hypothetical protein
MGGPHLGRALPHLGREGIAYFLAGEGWRRDQPIVVSLVEMRDREEDFLELGEACFRRGARVGGARSACRGNRGSERRRARRTGHGCRRDRSCRGRGRGDGRAYWRASKGGGGAGGDGRALRGQRWSDTEWHEGSVRRSKAVEGVGANLLRGELDAEIW